MTATDASLSTGLSAGPTTGPTAGSARCGLPPEVGDEVLLNRRAGIQFSGERRVRVTEVRSAIVEGFVYLDVVDLVSDREFGNLYCRVAGLTVYPRPVPAAEPTAT